MSSGNNQQTVSEHAALHFTVWLGKKVFEQATLTPQIGDALIGSAEFAWIVLPGDRIARRHALIRFVDGLWTVEEVDGKVAIDGEVRPTHVLSESAEMAIGPYRLTIEIEGMRPQPQDDRQSTSEASSASTKRGWFKRRAKSEVNSATEEHVTATRTPPATDQQIQQPKSAGSGRAKTMRITVLGLLLALGVALIMFRPSPPEESTTTSDSSLALVASTTRDTTETQQTQASSSSTATPAEQTPNKTPSNDDNDGTVKGDDAPTTQVANVDEDPGEAEDPEQKDSNAEDQGLSQKRLSQRYRQQAGEFLTQGNREQALASLITALDRLPNDEDIRKMLTQVSIEAARESADAGDHDQANRLLSALRGHEEVDALLTQLSDELSRAKEQAAICEDASRKDQAALDTIRKGIEREEFIDARQQLDRLARQSPDYCTEDVATFENDEQDLHQQVEQGIERQNEQRQRRIAEVTDVKRTFAECLESFNDNRLADAILHCEASASGSVDTPEKAEATLWLNVLKQQREKTLVELRDAADKCMETDDVQCSFANLRQALAVNPDDESVKERLDDLLNRQLEKAREAFSKAKFYQGTGRFDRMREYALSAQKLLPDNEHPLFKKSQKMLSQ